MTFSTQGVVNNCSETFCIDNISDWFDITVNVRINNRAAFSYKLYVLCCYLLVPLSSSNIRNSFHE